MGKNSLNAKLLKIQPAFIPVIILLIGLFYITTIRDGHDWGGDFSMYIHHAKNISIGKNYQDTGYIFNPFNPSIGPKSYPPIYPCFLAPIYYFFGLNLYFMKIQVILFFLLMLYAIYLNYRNELPPTYLFLLIFIISFNFHFWSFKDNILSDIPFTFFIYISFYFLKNLYNNLNHNQFKFSIYIFAGFLLYVSFGIRTIGIVFLPSLITYDLLLNKNLTFKTLVILSVFLSFAFAQSLILPQYTSYFSQFFLGGKIILNNIIAYFIELYRFWHNGYFNLLSLMVFIICSVAALFGFIEKVKDNLDISDIFLIYYLIIIVCWPARQGMRFLIPLIPLYNFYSISFLKKLNKYYNNKLSFLFSTFIICSIIFSYILKFNKDGFKPINEGIHKAESFEVFNYIRNHTKGSDVFIFFKPRVLALFTERSSSCYYLAKNDDELINYFKTISATYVIESKLQPVEDEYWNIFLSRNASKLTTVFTNNDFKIFKLKID